MNREEYKKQKVREWEFSNTLGISICDISELESNNSKYKINFGGMGDISCERAREFLNKLNEAISLVKMLNEIQ